jgi:hypothetical protein
MMIKKAKKFISALIQNFFITVIIGIVTFPVLISWVTGTLDVLVQFLTHNSPIWLVIISTLICVCYFHFARVKEFKPVQPKPEPEEFLIEDSGFKWLVMDHKNGSSSVDQIPFCAVHDSVLVMTPSKQYMCRETIGSKCDCKVLKPSEISFHWSLAKSKANSIITKYKTKH